ncbi:acyltransferase family protein [Sphingomonas sp. ERG5]|uniref:acyltransferase family protein n=1 Tax=Sphingomonas sp. ERG5 TaxID=1381597 RepID=UPI000B1121DF|nr:acyltransferase family protein [Sphingomonas sp. ERG5]
MRSYRKDIDGLRALAVLPITFFHAGIPGFSGGFIGVDVFFVISGFLITAIIARDLSARRFSYADFYERRIRRIFPALAGMLLFSLAAAYFLLLPSELPDFGASVVGTVVFVSNFVFYKQSGYFDGAADEKPLLHTWSLGIEEQFYIIFPVLLFLILRFAPRYARQVIALCAGLSLAACIYITPIGGSAAFYLIPTRAWELLAGSLIALGAVPKIAPAFWRAALSGAGIALIIAAIVLFNSETRFPGTAALLPVAGSALVIAYGEGTATARLLSLRPLTFIGLISYSLYLWHWPLIVFGRDLGLLDGRIGPAIAIVLLSIAAGYLSYRFVETPFRNRSLFSRQRIYRLATVGAAILLGWGFSYQYSNGLRSRFSPQLLAFDDGQYDFSSKREACLSVTGTADPARACVFGGKTATKALWGDSHGLELAVALGNAAHPLRSITYSSCPPALDFDQPGRPDCTAHNALVARYLIDHPEIHNVVIVAHYTAYLKVPGFQPGFVKTVDMLVGAGKSVVIIGPTPGENTRNVPRRLARSGHYLVPRSDYLERQKQVIAMLGVLQAKGAKVIWPSDYFCDAAHCRVTLDGKPILFDEHHLSMTAARYLADRIAPLIEHGDTEDALPHGVSSARGSAPAVGSRHPSME